MSKSSRRVKAARNQVVPAAEDKFHAAADRVGPLVHTAADRVGPLAHSAADRVGPMAEAAADRLGAAADKVSPLAHTAAEKLGPLAHNAADHVAPLTHSAADRMSPLAHSAADRIAPLAAQAVDRVSPYAQQAADRVSPYAQQAADYAHYAADLVSPYAQQAADRLAPLASSARKRGAQAAHDAAEKLGPVIDDALEKVGPALEDARGKVTDELLPKLSGALSAAVGSNAIAEVVDLPEPKKKGRWFKRVFVVAAVAAVIALVARRFLGSKDADWQAARPSTPYTPSKADAVPAEPPVPAPVDLSEAAAEDDPQAGQSAHEANLEANGEPVPDAPAEGADVAEPGPVEDVVADISLADEQPVEEPVDLEPVELEPAASDEFVPSNEPAPTDQTVVSDEPVFGAGPPPETPTAEIPEGALLSADLPSPSGDDETATGGAGRPRYEGEGVYVGNEPPEGYVIKGNERSKKYHLPDSGGYSRTVAEVWFNSEEAAQTAGFVRAQR